MPLSEKRIKTDFKARLGRTGLLLRGTLRLSSLLTPERAVARTTHLGVSPHLPSDKEIYPPRDYRPTFGVVSKDGNSAENISAFRQNETVPPTQCFRRS